MISPRVFIIGMVLCSCTVYAAESPKGDLNGDLRVDLSDFAILADEWLMKIEE